MNTLCASLAGLPPIGGVAALIILVFVVAFVAAVDPTGLAGKLLENQRAWQAANTELQTLAASDDITDDVMGKMRAAKAEMERLEPIITEQRTMVSALGDGARNAGALGITGMNFDGTRGVNERSQQQGGARLETFVQRGDEGSVHIFERNGMRMVEYDGYVLPEKTWNAISEDKYCSAFRAYVGKGGDLGRMDDYDRRALAEGDDTTGGFLVPADYQRRLIERKPAPTRLRANVEVLNTGSDTVVLPTVNYTDSPDNRIWPNGMRLTWTGETPASSTAHRVTQPAFGQINIPIGTAMLSQPLTLNFVEDAFIDSVGWLTDRFGIAVELTEESEIVSGPGTEGRMMGIMTAPGTTGQIGVVVSGSAADLTGDGIINLAYELDEQYDEDARFYLNKRNVAKRINTLKDNDGRYLWATGSMDDKLASAKPKQLAGYDYSYVAFMPDIAANTFPILHGDAKGFTLARRVGFSIKILTETYYEQNQLVAVGRLRIGGRVTEPWRMNAQKCSV